MINCKFKFGKEKFLFELKTIFPFWNTCQSIRPSSYRRRITIVSATNLPLINGIPPNTRATILVNGIAIAKSALVQNNCHPTYVRLTTDIDIDVTEEISVAEIPYEYLIKPPNEALHAFLRNDTKRDPDFQFALSGSVKLLVQGSNRLEEDRFSYAVRKDLAFRRLQIQQQANIIPPVDPTTPANQSASRTVTTVSEAGESISSPRQQSEATQTSIVKVFQLELREKRKKATNDGGILKKIENANSGPSKPIVMKGGQLTDEELNHFGMTTNLSCTHENLLNSQWIVLPAMDIGMSVGNPKKKANLLGTMPGNMISFAIERRADRLAVSDVAVIEDIQYDIAAALVHIRRRDLARKQRDKAIHFFQELLQRMNSLSVHEYDEKVLWRMLKMILTVCFPYNIIRLVRISKDFTTLFYETIQLPNFSSLKTIEELKKQPFASSSSGNSVLRIPKEYSRKDSTSFGRNFQRSFAIRHPNDLLRQNILLCSTTSSSSSLTKQQFPRIQANICAEDAVISLLQIENFTIAQGGNQFPMYHVEIEEIQQWLEQITMALGESIFQHKEQLIVENLYHYLKQWNSSLIGCYSMLLFEVQKILFGYRFLEVINIDAEYRLSSLLEKKPKTEQLYGRRVIIKHISLRKRLEDLQSVVSGTSVGQSITSSIKNFLLGGAASSSGGPGNYTSSAIGGSSSDGGESKPSSFGNVWKAAKKLFGNNNNIEEETEKDILDKLLEEGDETDNIPTSDGGRERKSSIKGGVIPTIDRLDSNDDAELDQPTQMKKEITNLVCGIKYEGMEQLFPIKHNPENDTFMILTDIILYIKSDYQVFVSIYEVNEESFQPVTENTGTLYLSLSTSNPDEYATETKILLSPCSAPTLQASRRAERTVYEFCYQWEWDESFSQSQQSFQIDQLEGFRLKILKANQLSVLKNKKLPNPFCEVLCQGKVIASTVKVKNSISPEWNEAVYVPINQASLAITSKNAGNSDKNRLVIDCYDSSSAVVKKGQFLGRISLSIDQVLSYTASSSNSSMSEGNDAGSLLELGLEMRKDMKANKQKFVGGKLSFMCKAVFKEENKKGGKGSIGGGAGSMKASKKMDPTAAMFSQINQMKNPHLIITVDAGKELPSANRFSNDSDPFVLMFVGKEEISKGKTKTINNSVNPIWDETFDVSLLQSKQNQHDISPEELAQLKEYAQAIAQQKEALNSASVKKEKKDEKKKAKQIASDPQSKTNTQPITPETMTAAIPDFFNTNMYENAHPLQQTPPNSASGKKRPKVHGGKQDLFLSDSHFKSLADLPNIRFEVYNHNRLTNSVLLGKCELSPQQYLLPQTNANAENIHREQSASVFGTSTKSNKAASGTQRFGEENNSVISNEITLNLAGFKNDFKTTKGKLSIKWRFVDLPLPDDEDEPAATDGKGLQRRRVGSKRYCFNEYNGLSLLSLIEINLFRINEISKSKNRSSTSSFFGWNSKINSYLIVKYQSKVIHQTKLIVNNPSPEFNERCSFLFNYEAVYTQIIGIMRANLSRQNSQLSGGGGEGTRITSSAAGSKKEIMKRGKKEPIKRDDSENLEAEAEAALNALDVTIELWLTDYFNNHECLGEFYLPASHVLHAANHEMVTLELIQKSDINEANNAKPNENKETPSATGEAAAKPFDLDEANNTNEESTPKRSASSLFSLTSQRDKDSKKKKKIVKTELTLMINLYRKFPEVHLQKNKYYPIYNQYETIIEQYTSSTSLDIKRYQQAQQYLQPNYTITGKPITMIYDPELEANRYKKDQLNASALPQLLEKSNQQIYKYYHSSPFEELGIISELHYGQLCAASRRGEKTVLKGPKAEIFCLPLFPTKQQLQSQAQLLQQKSLFNPLVNDLSSFSIDSPASSDLLKPSMKKKKYDPKAVVDNDYLLQLDSQLYSPGKGKGDDQSETKSKRMIPEGKKRKGFGEDDDDDSDSASDSEEEGRSLDSHQLSSVTEYQSPTILTMKELILQFYQQNHIYLLARYPKDQLPRKHMKYLEKLQSMMLQKMENIFFLRYAKQKQLLSLYENMKAFSHLTGGGTASASTGTNTKTNSQPSSQPHHHHHHIRLDEMIIQSLLEFETSTDCPIKLYLLAENGIDFAPVTLDTFGDGEIAIAKKKSISTKFRSQSDNYDLIAKIILICRYQIIIQYYQSEITLLKSHWEQYLPNDLPHESDPVITELNKLFAGNHYHTMFPPAGGGSAAPPSATAKEGKDRRGGGGGGGSILSSDTAMSSLKYKYHFQNDYYQQFYFKSSTFFEDVFHQIREQYPNGVLFLPLVAHSEMMMGLIIIKNINSSFPKVEYHYSIPEEYFPSSSLNPAPAADNDIAAGKSGGAGAAEIIDGKKIITTPSGEKIFSIESMEHGILPIINKSSQIFSENIFITKIDNAMRTIKSFSLKARTIPIKFLLFCFWQIVQAIPAIREVSIWMIHRNHVFIEKRNYPSGSSGAGTNRLTENSVKGPLSSRNSIISQDSKAMTGVSAAGKVDDNDEEEDGDEAESETVQSDVGNNDPFSYLAKLFRMKKPAPANESSKKITSTKKRKNRRARRGNRSSQVSLTTTSLQQLEGIMAGFFGAESVTDLLELDTIKHYKTTSSKTIMNLRDFTRKRANSTAKRRMSFFSQIDPNNKNNDWKLDIPEVFQHYLDETVLAELMAKQEAEKEEDSTNLLREKLLNKFFMEKIYREIIYCIENRGLSTFPIMTGHTLSLIGKDSSEVNEMLLQQIFHLPISSASIGSPGALSVGSSTSFPAPEMNNPHTISGITNTTISFSEAAAAEEPKLNHAISQITSASNLSKSSSVGVGTIKKPPLPPGPPPSYANRVAASENVKSPSSSLSPYISPRPPQQPPPTTNTATMDSTDDNKIENKEGGIAAAKETVNDGAATSSSNPEDPAVPSLSSADKDRFYFCLSVKTHGKALFRMLSSLLNHSNIVILLGIGGDSGWGLIGDHAQKAIADIVSLMEASLLKLSHLQKEEANKNQQV